MPSENLKTALLPHDIIEGDVQANLAAVAKRLENLDSDVDLVVLPEMFNSGFTADPAVLARTAETNTGTTITTVQEWASKFGMHIWGGFTAVDNGRYYNRGFMVSPDGQRVFYDKRHLFRYGGESEPVHAGRFPLSHHQHQDLECQNEHLLRPEIPGMEPRIQQQLRYTGGSRQLGPRTVLCVEASSDCPCH